MRVPFLDLTRQTQSVLEEFLLSVRKLAKQNRFIGGAPVREFEETFATYCGVPYCVAVNSGTDGLRLALIGAGVRPQDEVITSPFTFAATTEAISQSGKLVLADIDPETFTLSTEAVKERLTDKTKVVLPVHIFGLPAAMEKFVPFCQRNGLTIVEDACQAHGAEIRGRKVGSFGQSASFSFYPTKNLGGFGDGGAVTSQSEAVSFRIRRLGNHGEVKRYKHAEEGFNSRMDTFQAIALKLKLKFLDQWIEQRRSLAKLYHQELQSVDEVQFQKEPAGCFHTYYVVAARVKRRSQLANYLADLGIETRVIYPTPIHLLEAYSYLNHHPGDFPAAEKLCQQVLCFPVYPGMAEADVLKVSCSVREFYAG